MAVRYLSSRENMVVSKQHLGDLEPEFLEIWEAARPATMTPIEVGYSLYQAVKDVSERGVPGCFVECGVWRGGSSMVAAQTLLRRGDVRDLYLFDTYKGMPMPTENDGSRYESMDPMVEWRQKQQEEHNDWCYAPVELVRQNLLSTGYPAERLHFVEGKVEDTLPVTSTGDIAILRLDTDWYASTKVEMETLYPRLNATGYLVLDDYGYWEGCRKAVDEYFSARGSRPLLHRINFGSRIGVKLDERR